MTTDGKKKNGFKWSLLRHAVQIGILLFFLIPPLVAGWSLFGFDLGSGGDDAVATPHDLVFSGSLSASLLAGVDIMDPFGFLQVLFASKHFAVGMLVAVLPPLVVYGLIRGRAFCGWVCPVNLLLEGLDWLRGKAGIQVQETRLPRHAKIWIAVAVLLLSALLSVPFFELFSPISAINKGLLFGSMAGLITLVAIILIELFWGHRVWCRALCPLGGFYEVLGRVGVVSVKMDHGACVNCNACKLGCLCDSSILDAVLAGEDTVVRAGDCMLCGKCVEACPRGALRFGLGRGAKPLPAASTAVDASEEALPVVPGGTDDEPVALATAGEAVEGAELVETAESFVSSDEYQASNLLAAERERGV